jgi:hypothetical protein
MSDGLIVIGITGLARSGKDTVAKILELNHGFTRIGLADGVRSAFADLDVPTWEQSKGGMNIRNALQMLGAESRETLDADASEYHRIHHALIKISFAHSVLGRDRFVIPDVRFPREAAERKRQVEIWDGRFYCLRLVRPGISGLQGEAAKHSSESRIDEVPVDRTIVNNGAIQLLGLDLGRWLNTLKGTA